MARRALDLTVPAMRQKTSIALSRSMAYHPEVQHAVAQMALTLDPVAPHIEKVAEDWSTGRRSWRVLAGEDRLGQVSCRRGLLAHRRSGDGGLGRRGNVQDERARAAVQRRPLRALPSRERSAWCTRSSARRRSASSLASSRAGGSGERAHSARRQLADQRLIRGNIIPHRQVLLRVPPRTLPQPARERRILQHPQHAYRPNPSDRRTAPAGHSARA